MIDGYRFVEVLIFPCPITGDNSFSAVALSAKVLNLFQPQIHGFGVLVLNNIKQFMESKLKLASWKLY